MEIIYTNSENAVAGNDAVEAISFENGENASVQDFLGVKRLKNENVYRFRAYVPGAHRVELSGDFIFWGVKDMHLTEYKDVWECTVSSDVPLEGMCYIYRYYNERGAFRTSDICAGYGSISGSDESIVYTADEYEWRSNKTVKGSIDTPINIMKYDMGAFIGSRGEYFNYRDIGVELSEFAADAYYTHVAISFDRAQRKNVFGSTGYFMTPPADFGRPEDVMCLVDELHCHKLGAIICMKICPNAGRGEISGRERSVIISAIVLMHKRFRFDGVMLSFADEKGRAIKASDDQLAIGVKSILEIVRRECPQMLLITEDCGIDEPQEENNLDLYLATRVNDAISNVVCAAEETKRYKYPMLNYELMNCFGKNGIVCLTINGTKERNDGECFYDTDRLMLAGIYVMLHPGKKMTNYLCNADGLDALEKRFLKQLNKMYLSEASLWERDSDRSGFEWLCHADNDRGVSAFVRYSNKESLVAIFNFDNKRNDGVVICTDIDCECFECIFGASDKDIDGIVKMSRNEKGNRLILDLPPLYAAVYRPRTYSE